MRAVITVIEVYLNDVLLAAAGGESIDQITFGVLRASNAEQVSVQLTGFEKASARHCKWLYRHLTSGDRIRVKFGGDSPISPPMDVWQAPPISEKEGLKAGFVEVSEPLQEVQGSIHSPYFAVSLSDGVYINLDADIGANLQVTIVWQKATGQCEIECAALRNSPGGQEFVELKNKMRVGSSVSVEVRSPL